MSEMKSDGNSTFDVDYKKVLSAQRTAWTLRSLGIKPKADYEQALKKRRKIIKKNT